MFNNIDPVDIAQGLSRSVERARDADRDDSDADQIAAPNDSLWDDPNLSTQAGYEAMRKRLGM